jgi:dihydroorotate dehydrogenase electron transfer subunit
MSKKILFDAPVLSNEKICDDVYLLKFKHADFANIVLPGQFVQVSTNFENQTFLRRPISIFDVDKDKSIVMLLYKVVGKGTHYFSSLQKDDSINILGPLGNSFTLEYKKPLIIGGGIGVAPLKYLVREYNREGVSPTLSLGFANIDQSCMASLFTELDCDINICTDEKSSYFHGNSCQLAEVILDEENYDSIYACGPNIMLKNVPITNLPTFISLEEYMACGVGACLGCAVKTIDNNYVHVCKDGPIFDAKGVILNE